MNRVVMPLMLAVAMLAGLFGFAVGAVGTSTPHPTWNYQVEDDTPACWLEIPHVKCGPYSWAPARAVYVTPPFTSCEEDQPCWDCRTMGNRICGPRP